MRHLTAAISGALFGAGLFLSGMIDPARVLGFLDVAGGAWDPTLAFVLAGAMLPMMAAWRILGRRNPELATPSSDLDPRLVAGGLTFGLGWGLVGLCPGPALALLGLGGWPAAMFCVAMICGLLLRDWQAGRS